RTLHASFTFARTCDPQHATGVLLGDALPIRRSEPDRIEIGDRLADELRTLLGIEGHVAAKEHVVDAEKLDRATKGVFGAEERGVPIEHLVIVERTLAQPSRERAEVLLGRARAYLGQPRTDPAGTVRHPPA